MGKNYYALVAGLPDILLEDKKVLYSSAELRENLSAELQPADFKLVQLLYMPFDHQNFLNRYFKRDQEWDERGNLPRDTVEQLQDRKSYEAANLELLPDYFLEFLEQIHGEEGTDDFYAAELQLTKAYYEHLDQVNNSFLRALASYHRTIANVMVALNGRKHELAFDQALVGDDEITAALRKSRTRDFGLANEVHEMEHLIQLFEGKDLLERELRLDRHQWDFIDEETFFAYFTIEKVLAFVQKLLIVERWMALDAERGKEMFNQLLNDLEAGFQFPEEFTLGYGKK